MQRVQRDPRLAELEFLSYLSKTNTRTVHRLSGPASDATFGLAEEEFHALVIHVLTMGYANGPAEIAVGGTPIGSLMSESLDSMKARDVNEFVSRRYVTLRLNHEGRLRLWQLREELRSKRTMEPFGVLLGREFWPRDFETAFAFLPTGGSVALLTCDLDHFKSVNDSLNHLAGDSALKRYLQVVKDVTEKFGDAYRIGGDEVIAILPGSDSARAAAIAEALRCAVESAMSSMPELKTLPKKPTLSVGVKAFAARISPEDAQSQVDALLYKAKNAGRNRVEHE